MDFFGELSLLLDSDHQRATWRPPRTASLGGAEERFDALLADNPVLADRIRRRAEERTAADTSADADAQPLPVAELPASSRP